MSVRPHYKSVKDPGPTQHQVVIKYMEDFALEDSEGRASNNTAALHWEKVTIR